MKHKHADLIHAWADGAQIEWRSKQYTSNQWYPCNNPSWDDICEYRLKQKPNVIRCIVAEATSIAEVDYVQVFRSEFLPPNLRLTFDGETGKLKSAEVL